MKSVSKKLSSQLTPYPVCEIRFRETFRLLFKIQRYCGILITRYPGEAIIRNSAIEKINSRFGERFSKIGLVSWLLRSLVFIAYICLFLFNLVYLAQEIGGIFSEQTGLLFARFLLACQGLFNLIFFGVFSDGYRKLLLKMDELSLKTSHPCLNIFLAVSVILFIALPCPFAAYFLYLLVVCPTDRYTIMHNLIASVINASCISVPLMVFSSISIFLIVFYKDNIDQFKSTGDIPRKRQIKLLFKLASIVKEVDQFFSHLAMVNIFFACGGVCFACHCFLILAHKWNAIQVMLLFTFVLFWTLTFIGFLGPAVYLNEKSREIKWNLLEADEDSLDDRYHLISVVASALIVWVQFSEMQNSRLNNGTSSFDIRQGLNNQTLVH